MKICFEASIADVLMPLCRKHGVSPKEVLSTIIKSEGFEDLLIDTVEYKNDKETHIK